MKDTDRISKDDVTALLKRRSDSGVVSVHVGLPSSDRSDPQRWLSAVKSGLKDLARKRSEHKGLAELLQTAEQEIAQMPVEARRRSLIYYRSMDPDWSLIRSTHLHLPDMFTFDPSPQVRYLVALLDETPVLGVAVISQDRTRILTWNEGLVEEGEALDFEEEEEEVRAMTAAEGKSTVPAGSTRSGALPRNRVADQVRRRFTRVAQHISEAASAHGWQRILLVGPTATTASVRDALPDSWKRSLVDGLDRNLIKAPAAEIGAAAARQVHEWKRRTELAEVEQSIDDARSGRRAACGVEVCLEHLHERRVERLYVCGDLQMSGFSDGQGKLYMRAPKLGAGESVKPEPRLVERMIVQALESGASVVPVEGEPCRKLHLNGGVGARLRWKDAGNGLFPGA